MEKLFIWYNPIYNSFYSKWCKDSTYKEGYVNQYGHILIQILEFECYLQEDYTLRRGISLSEHVKTIRYRGKYNPYIKYKFHDNLIDRIYYDSEII